MMIIRVLIFIMFASSGWAEERPDVTKQSEGDTYNFYFQKAPGPTTVQQGGVQQTSGITTPIKSEVATTAIEKQETKFDFTNWEITAGQTSFYDAAGSGLGFAIVAKKNKTKYIGYFGGFNYDARGVAERSSRSGLARWDLQAGLEGTPIFVDMFGYTLIEIGATLGVMTYMAGDLNEHLYYARPDPKSYKSLGAFAGIKTALNVSKEFAVVFDNKFIFGAKGAWSVLGVRYRF